MKKATKKRINRKLVNGVWVNEKSGTKLTHNDGWWTKSRFMSMFSSALKDLTKYWRPKTRYKKEHLMVLNGVIKGQCQYCYEWFESNKLEVDHIVPCGSLKELSDLGEVAARTFIESQDGWQLLCKLCHGIKSYSERYNVTLEQAAIRKEAIKKIKEIKNDK
jgi:hypothetical protein